MSKPQKQATSIEYENQSNKNNELIKKDLEIEDEKVNNINNSDQIYKKIGISKECYDTCKAIFNSEGYIENLPCSDDENKKIIEYSKTNPNIFE